MAMILGPKLQKVFFNPFGWWFFFAPGCLKLVKISVNIFFLHPPCFSPHPSFLQFCGSLLNRFFYYPRFWLVVFSFVLINMVCRNHQFHADFCDVFRLLDQLLTCDELTWMVRVQPLTNLLTVFFFCMSGWADWSNSIFLRPPFWSHVTDFKNEFCTFWVVVVVSSRHVLSPMIMLTFVTFSDFATSC